MDNLSHSVAGLAAGELTHRLLPPEADAERQSLRRRLFLMSGALACNVPDLDLVLTPLLPEPLGYLLHHRGHTHTLLYALPQAVLLWAVLWAVWPSARGLLRDSRSARAGLAIVVAGGLLLHLVMDYLNSYGLHPFHPFDPGWFYGDMVFILEPFFWIAFGVPMTMALSNPLLKAALLLALGGIVLYFTVTQYLPWTSFLVLVTIGACLGLLQHRAGKRGIAALAAAVLTVGGFVGVQWFASGKARTTVAAHLAAVRPDARLLDVALTPFPANPACWTMVSVERLDSSKAYLLRRGVVSIAPRTLAAADCPAAMMDRPVPAEDGMAVAILSTHQGSLERLQELAARNCHVGAWMRFARTPLLQGEWLSDLRFSASPRGNFTALQLSKFDGRACADHIPQWEMPRRDLLEP